MVMCVRRRHGLFGLTLFLSAILPLQAQAAAAWKNLPRSQDTDAPRAVGAVSGSSAADYAGASQQINPAQAAAAGMKFWLGAAMMAGTISQMAGSSSGVTALPPMPGMGKAPGSGPSPQAGGSTGADGGGEYEAYYSRLSRAGQLSCSPDVSQQFRDRWSRFTDSNLADFYRMAIEPGQVRRQAEQWGPQVRQHSAQAQRNELGGRYFRALDTAHKACQITVACQDGDRLYESFPAALTSGITTAGRPGETTGALMSLQVAYAAYQMNAEFVDEYAYYIRHCLPD